MATPIRSPVSSLRALAHGSHERRRLALIDARRGEVYAALYDGDSAVVAPLVAPPAEVVAWVGSIATDPLALGDGSLRFRDVFEAAGIRVAPAGSRVHEVRGLSICKLALSAGASAAEAVLPYYVRAPDAAPPTT